MRTLNWLIAIGTLVVVTGMAVVLNEANEVRIESLKANAALFHMVTGRNMPR